MQYLSYAYATPDEISAYPLLGSAIRAIGKGWRVGVVGSKDELTLFEKMQKLLKEPQLLSLQLSKAYEENERKISCELLLSTKSVLYNKPKDKDEEKPNKRKHYMAIDRFPVYDAYDLISDFSLTHLSNDGVIAVTGNGKGKTTTALGIAAEAMTRGEKVAVVQWFKERNSKRDLTWTINEHVFPEKLNDPELFQFYPTGAGFVGSPNMDRVKEMDEHIKKAKEGVQLAKKMVESGEYAVVVLDEFVDTLPQVMEYLPYPLLEIKEVQSILSLAKRTKTILVVTGRRLTSEWQMFVKTSIVIREVKHPWSSKKQGAISGLDF